MIERIDSERLRAYYVFIWNVIPFFKSVSYDVELYSFIFVG